MTNLHDARVEAAAKAMYGRDFDRSKELYPDLPDLWAKDRPAYAEYAALALAAADAVVTVEMIADEISGHPIGSGYYQTTVGTGEAREIASAVLALIRGGGEQ